MNARNNGDLCKLSCCVVKLLHLLIDVAFVAVATLTTAKLSPCSRDVTQVVASTLECKMHN
jgi:hypothetical protein